MVFGAAVSSSGGADHSSGTANHSIGTAMISRCTSVSSGGSLDCFFGTAFTSRGTPRNPSAHGLKRSARPSIRSIGGSFPSGDEDTRAVQRVNQMARASLATARGAIRSGGDTVRAILALLSLTENRPLRARGSFCRVSRHGMLARRSRGLAAGEESAPIATATLSQQQNRDSSPLLSITENRPLRARGNFAFHEIRAQDARKSRSGRPLISVGRCQPASLSILSQHLQHMYMPPPRDVVAPELPVVRGIHVVLI